MKSIKNNLLSTALIIVAFLCPITGSINAMELMPERQKVAISQSQMDHIKEFQVFLAQRKGPNNEQILLPTEADLLLLQEALNIINKNPTTFNTFYDTLNKSEQVQLSSTAKNVGFNRITSLINKKEKQESPSTKISYESIITLPSTEILNQRLKKNEFIYYQELGDKLGGITSSVAMIVEQINSILTNKHKDDPFMLSTMLMNRPLIIQLILQDNPDVIKFLRDKNTLPK